MSNILKYQNPSSPLLVQRINKSGANFVKRLLDPNRKSIPDWETKGSKIATHKLGWAEDDHGAYVFPEVQEIDGRLVDFSRPPYALGIAEYMAHKNNNIVRMSPEEADWFTRNYKQYYPSFKKGGSIHIKKKNRGKFTEYCGGKVTEECIAKGKKSKDPKIRKRATFAANARKWKHADGGIIKYQNPSSPILVPGQISPKDIETSFNINWYKGRAPQLRAAMEDKYDANRLIPNRNLFENYRKITDDRLTQLVTDKFKDRLSRIKEFTSEEALKNYDARKLLTLDYYESFPYEKPDEDKNFIGPPKPVPNDELEPTLRREMASGRFYPLYNTIIYDSVFGDNSSKIHERTHAIVSDFNPIMSKVHDIRRELKDRGEELHHYWDSADEIYARLMEFREKHNLDPTKVITEEDINNWKKNDVEDFELLNRYPVDILLRLFNDVAQNTTNQNRLDYRDPITIAKNGSKIHIKKRTISDDNTKKWKHQNGGILKAQKGVEIFSERIPTLEEYIQMKQQEARQMALVNSYNAIEPRLVKKYYTEDELNYLQFKWRDHEDRSNKNNEYADEIEKKLNHPLAPKNLFIFNPIYRNAYTNTRLNDYGEELLKELASHRVFAMSNDNTAKEYKDDLDYINEHGYDWTGYNCITNATGWYGDPYVCASNIQFKKDPSKYGFVEINADDALPGDIFQYDKKGIPNHVTMYSKKGDDGTYYSNYANGNHLSNIIHDSTYWGKGKRAFRFIGLPKDNEVWTREYNELYGKKFGGVLDKFKNGGILKAQEGTGNLYAPHPLSPVGIALNQAKIAAKMKGEQQYLPPRAKEVIGPDGKKIAIRTEQPLIPLEQSIAEWLPGTGDVVEIGYVGNDLKEGRYGTAAMMAGLAFLPGNWRKLLDKIMPTKKDKFVDFFQNEIGKTVKRVPVTKSDFGGVYSDGFRYLDESGKEIAHIAGSKHGDRVFVESSFMDPEFRSKGIGKQMYFDFNDQMFDKYGKTIGSNSGQHMMTMELPNSNVRISPSGNLWRGLRKNGLATTERPPIVDYIMAKPKTIKPYKKYTIGGKM